ncbi:MAG: glycosyltransferase [Desulfohalobiaceae bacterium]|nr:glycosyltransferase [Desulfohalobiaceae bacterium]
MEKLRGLDACELVDSGILFRRHPVGRLKKFRQICPPSIFRSSAVLSHLFALLVTIPWCLRFQPHVCVGISLLPHSVLAKLGQIFCRAKFVTWLIGTDIYLHLAQRWWGKLLRSRIASASCTITMGSGSNRMLESMGWPSRNLIVGRNAYDLSDYLENQAEKQWDIIYTGRLDRAHKRISLLLQAVAEMRTSCPSVRCAIVGKGPDRKRLEGICNSLRLHSNVEFLGFRPDIPELLNKSRILVMTSAWEGLPSSIVESFALGLPVVVADVGDISDIVINGENGILINSVCPAEYARAVLKILESPETYHRMSYSAKKAGEGLRREIDNGFSTARWQQAIVKAGLLE